MATIRVATVPSVPLNRWRERCAQSVMAGSLRCSLLPQAVLLLNPWTVVRIRGATRRQTRADVRTFSVTVACSRARWTSEGFDSANDLLVGGSFVATTDLGAGVRTSAGSGDGYF